MSAKILQALKNAHLALSATHNLLVTDRPDLPLAPETSWTTNNTKELADIESAIEILGGVAAQDGVHPAALCNDGYVE